MQTVIFWTVVLLAFAAAIYILSVVFKNLTTTAGKILSALTTVLLVAAIAWFVYYKTSLFH